MYAFAFRSGFSLFPEVSKTEATLTLSLSKVRIFAHFLKQRKLEKYGTFDDVMSVCGLFTDETPTHTFK